MLAPNRSLLLVAALLASLPACRAEEPGSSDDYSTASESIREGDPEAVGMLRFLNDAATTVPLLDDEVGLDSRAAQNLIAHRDGSDGAFGTSDDNLFGDVAEVDGVKYVGPSALQKIIDYAEGAGWVPEGDEVLGTYDDVSFTVNEAEATLTLVNTASDPVLDDEVPLDRRAVDSILAARPIFTVLELSLLKYVGTSALLKLRDYATAISAGGYGSDCATHADCDAGLKCTGIPHDGSPETGKCFDSATNIPGDGDDCDANDPCGPGLSCAGTTVYGGHGFCRPLWMTGNFESTEVLAIPDGPSGSVQASVVVYGLATVPEDVLVTVDIDHPRPEDLVVKLIAPTTAESTIWSHVASFPENTPETCCIERDNFVNGTWILEVSDTAVGQTGTLRGFSLTISSRFD